ncbi:13661_t:CDS:2 [Racocetra fulgida]|uniref:Protein phosphatase methylesterase 1 n=1 Tax=Racocetra fulgida TaxID=60492 RepID=A0A9N9AB21_9GLOM|nr:13661_t:CDS:2 [Racocetra fulgida]
MSFLQKEIFKRGNRSTALSEPIINEEQEEENEDSKKVIKEAEKSDIRTYDIQGKAENPLFVFHHGAGYSGLSFALAALHIKNLTNSEFAIFAYDWKTKTSDDLNLSLDQLSQDLTDVLKAAFGNDVITDREIFLVGHSMGGCVVADATSKQLIPSVTCMAVIDVVEEIDRVNSKP